MRELQTRMRLQPRPLNPRMESALMCLHRLSVIGGDVSWRESITGNALRLKTQ